MYKAGCVVFSMDQPEGMPKVNRNPYRVALSVEETLKLLVLSANEIHNGCCIFPDCETCNGALACWWDIYNVLRREDKLEVAISLAGHGVELPEAPWELEEEGR
jgi:hypothetical protein